MKNTLAKNCCRHESVEEIELDEIPFLLRGYTIKRIPIFPKKRPKSDYFLKQ